MSMIKDLEAAQGELVALRAEFEAFKVKLAGDAEAVVKAHGAVVASFDAQILTLTDANAKLTADVSAAQALVVDAQAAVAAANATREDALQKLGVAEKKLANPAFADASMGGRAAPLDEGGEATPPSAGSPTWDEYNKITEPAKRTAFWNANEAKLRAEMVKANKG
jgi:predicted amidohydrolase YtcJ